MKTKKFRFLAISLMSFLLFPIESQADFKNSLQYEECLKNVDYGAFKNSQWVACARDELKNIDAILNSEYSRARKQLTSEQQTSMIKAQRAWLKYREDWCRFEEVGPGAPGGEASYHLCLLETTGIHIKKIKGIVK
jgi:uncharacterized protein YecT (DUF1311 family)